MEHGTPSANRYSPDFAITSLMYRIEIAPKVFRAGYLLLQNRWSEEFSRIASWQKAKDNSGA